MGPTHMSQPISRPIPRPTGPISRPVTGTVGRPVTGVAGRSPTGAIPRPNTNISQRQPALGQIEAETFRPRGALAAAIILAPALVVLALYAALLISAAHGVTQQALIGLGFGISLAWVLTALAGARILLVTAKATSEGIQTSYPWGGQHTLNWLLIDHVDRQMGFVRMRSSDGQKILLLLNGLANGERLMRLMLLRVSPTILSAPLQQELALLGGGVYRTRYTPPMPRIGMSPIWQGLAGCVGLCGAGLAAWASLTHSGVVLLIGVALGLVGVACLFILRQTLTLTETDITLERGFGSPVTLTWSEIKLIEYSPLQMMMALRGERRIVFIGAFFMTPNRRAHLQRAFSQHLTPHNVPVLQRWFIY